MKPRTTLLLLTPVLLLGACGLVARAIAIPVALVLKVLALPAYILVGAEGSDREAELRAGGVRVDRHVLEVELTADLTYAATLVVEQTITGTAGLAGAQRASLNFDPRSQELELVRAEVIGADGTRYAVGEDRVFTRPSAAAQATPGFVNTLTKTVVFPQLSVGARTAVEWRFRERARSMLGFNYVWRPSFAIPVTQARIRITHPTSVPLRVATHGDFEVHDKTERDRRVVQVELRDYQGQKPERAMVDPRDVCPVVAFSTVKNREEIGARFHAAVRDRIEVTPEIRAKAAEIVGDRQGLAAARAIHRWVCRNIQYIAVYLGQADGWVPSPASRVLADGYGDCKGQFVLLASLLRARDITAEPVLIDLGRSWRPLPLATTLQFDHCMAWLPQFDLYSNPTDPYHDLGDLDVALSDKLVVIGTEHGRVARTPAGKAADHTYRAHHEASLAADGRMTGSSRIEVTGRPSASLRRKLALAADSRQVVDGILLDTPEGGVDGLQTSAAADLDVPLWLSGSWKSELTLALEPTLYFRAPVGIDLVTPARVREFLFLGDRRYPLVMSALDLRWSYEIRLPEGYEITRHPRPQEIDNPRARFSTRYEWRDGRLRIERQLQLKQDRYAPDEYAALREVLAAAAGDLGSILVATRKP